jgi:hypothetical protein
MVGPQLYIKADAQLRVCKLKGLWSSKLIEKSTSRSAILRAGFTNKLMGDLTLTHKSLFINRTAALDQHLLIVGLDLIMHEGKKSVYWISVLLRCIAYHIEPFFFACQISRLQ